MERHGGDFEENSDEHEGQSGKNEGLVLHDRSECGDLVDLRGSSGAEDERDAVEQKAVAKDPSRKYLMAASGPRPVCLRQPARM